MSAPALSHVSMFSVEIDEAVGLLPVYEECVDPKVEQLPVGNVPRPPTKVHEV